MRDSAERPSGLLSAVIVNYNGGNDLALCVESLLRQSLVPEIVVFDNASTDWSAKEAALAFPHVRVIQSSVNLGFAGGANSGALSASGDLLLFLNPDVCMESDCVERLAHCFDSPRVGVAGPAVKIAASNHIDYGATIDPLGYPLGLSSRAQPPLYVPGCALATRATVFRQLNGFDDRFFMFVEDVDYCWRSLLSGWDVVIEPEALAHHAGGAVARGGYVRRRRLETNSFRVALRERNTLATLLKCYAGISLVGVIPAYLASSVATAFLLTLQGHRAAARALLGGLLWNVKQLPQTFALRQGIQSNRTARENEIISRMYLGLRKVSLAWEVGLPRVSE